jgi:plasmid stabilization system protein ParE
VARVVWTFPARRQLRQIHEFIEQDSRRAGRLFADRIIEATRQSEQFPRVG